jgi:hypothetical protein
MNAQSVVSGYKSNYVTLKKYTDNIYKLTHIKFSTRVPGFEFEDDFYSGKGTVNGEKSDNNISRARSKIFGYAMCNKWEYFSTFTIDKTKFDRYNLETYHKAFAQWLRYYNRKNGFDIKYLTIPEKHKDNAWHEHGFIMGLPLECLKLFTLDEKLPKYIRDKLKNGDKVYNWLAYAEKFGFVDFEIIRNPEAVSKYVTKYISKDLAHSVTNINAHLYYSSKGLKLPEVIKTGTPSTNGIPVTWENEYVAFYWIKDGNINKLDSIIQWD